jgi:hypothetical protein
MLKLLEKYIMYDESCNFDDCKLNNDNQLIDMQHHNIRFYCMYISFWLKTIKFQDQESNQLKRILEKILYAKLCVEDCWKIYRKKLNDNKALNNDKKCYQEHPRDLPILSYNNALSSRYNRYEKIIKKFIIHVRSKIENILKGEDVNLCPYETIILYYMFNICDYGYRHQDLTITELYEITHIYYTEFTHNISGHNDCMCCNIDCFPDNKDSSGTLCKYLQSHYEKIKLIGKQYIKFLANNPKLNILIDKYIIMNDSENNFKISNCYTIGYNNDTIYIIYLHPSYNELNHNSYIIQSILDTWFILNRKLDKENDLRFRNKNIKCVLFSYDDDNYYIFNWNNNLLTTHQLLFKIGIIKNYIFNLHCLELDNYYHYIKINYTNCTSNDYEEKLTYTKHKYEDIFKNMYDEKKRCKYLIDYIDYLKDDIDDIDIVENYVNTYKIYEKEIIKKINKSINNFLDLTATDHKQYNSTYI